MKVNVHKGRLTLLGTLPAKDGSGNMRQQRIALRMSDTPANRAKAEKVLKKAIAELNSGKWDWSNWQFRTVQTNKGNNGSEPPKTWTAAIRAFHRKKVTLGRTSESTWKVNHWGTLKFCPMEETVTTEGIEKCLSRYERDQYTYKKLYYDCKHIARICFIEFPEVGVPLYKTSSMDPTDVPSDSEIIEWVTSAKTPYRWYFGMMATYGLRPHECDTCRMVQNGDGIYLVQVDDATKTGYRTVIPQQLEWVELFDLTNKTDRPESNRDPDRNDGCSCWLNAERLDMKIRWRSYALRHAYAGRLWRNGGSELEVFTAAQVMGHSVKEHIETYRRWIDPNKVATSALDAITRNQLKVRGQLEKSFNRKNRSQVDSQSAS